MNLGKKYYIYYFKKMRKVEIVKNYLWNIVFIYIFSFFTLYLNCLISYYIYELIYI